MEKQVVRVEPFSTYGEKRKVQTSFVVMDGALARVSRPPHFDVEVSRVAAA